MSRNTSSVASKRILENIKEATGASEDDVVAMLQICNGDANEATERLLESEHDKRYGSRNVLCEQYSC